MKKLLRFCAVVAMLLSISAANAVTGTWTSGSTTVELTEDGTLTVSGTGAMANYDNTNRVPWEADRAAIKTVVIDEGVTSIGGLAFSSCGGLTSVTIPNSVTRIEESAFSSCISLTSVTIPNSVISIGWRAFSSCISLISVTIPESVMNIGILAFGICSSLTAINVDDANPQYSSVEGVLYNKNQSALLLYPRGKQRVFTIPNGVTRIEESAFYLSSITSITLPNSIRSIGLGAFASVGVTSVTCLAATPPGMANSNFTLIDSDTLYVPASSLAAYQNESAWSSAFGTILALADTPIETVTAEQLSVYLNPTNDVVYIRNANGATVNVYNLNGELLKSVRESSIDLSNYPAGVYLLRAGNKTAKVIKK